MRIAFLKIVKKATYEVKTLKRMKSAAEEILVAAKRAIDELDQGQVEKMIQMILDAKERKIFVIGMGRSGFVGRAFTLRLMNLGFNVYFLGETITPAAVEEDLVIAISGSGVTKIVYTVGSTAKEFGLKVIAITSHPDSPMGRIADQVVVVKGRTKLAEDTDYMIRQLLGEREPLSPLGTMFENNCMIFLDSLIVELMYRLGKTEEEIRVHHGTIE